MNIQVCRDPSDAVALYLPQRLYLKSFAKLNISVQLPSNKVHGKPISNWELMEKLRKMIQPDSFSMLKVSKHSSEIIRFDAELESREKLERVMLRLADRIIQLNDYPDQLKVRVSEAKSDIPSRHDWDLFFRDATDMDEMKPGERPDTIHISNLPIRWFVHEKDLDEDAPPSENIFKKVFEKFGSIRQVDVPVADPFRMQMKSAIRGIKTAPTDAALYFEGYIQFSEYVSFVRCLDALRGHKLLRKGDGVSEWCSIKVDFDKTKHMTDAAVKRRSIVRERLSARKRAKDEEEKVEQEKIAKKEAKERQKLDRVEREKLEKTREREERRKKKQLAKLMERDNLDLNSKVAEEQKKLMKSQKKLQAIRLIEEMFKRIELRPELQHSSSSSRSSYYQPGDCLARARIVDKYKRHQEDLLEAQRNHLKNVMNGRIVIRSALETKKPKRDSSISSISSDERDSHKRVKTEKLSTPEREMEFNKAAASMYGVPYSFGYPFPCPPGYGYAPPPPQTSMYYPVRGAYYPPPAELYQRRPYRARGRARGRPRMPFFHGPDASQQYYRYFKKLTEAESRNEHDERDRSRSRSRRRSYTRSRSRSRSRSHSRSRRRSHTRSRSRSRRSRSRRSRSRSRRSRSRSRRSRSYHSRSRSRSHRRSRSRTRRSRSRSKPQASSPEPKRSSPHDRAEPRDRASVDSAKRAEPNKKRSRSRSWSSPRNGDKEWFKSPKDN